MGRAVGFGTESCFTLSSSAVWEVFNQKYIFSLVHLLVQNVHSLLNYDPALSMCCCLGSQMKHMIDKIDSSSFPSWLWQILLFFISSVSEIQTIDVVSVTVMALSMIMHVVKFC